MILDNLKKAGVQNTRKGERLTFDRLDPTPGSGYRRPASTRKASLYRNPLDCGTSSGTNSASAASPSPSARSTARSARSR